jgi:hypothetical protein
VQPTPTPTLWRDVLPLIVAGVIPLIVGVVVWSLSGEWRWGVTGLIAAVTAPLLVAALYLIFAEEDDPFSFVIWILMVLTLLGLPVGLSLWMWTGAGTWGLVALLSPVLTVFTALAAMIVESESD